LKVEGMVSSKVSHTGSVMLLDNTVFSFQIDSSFVDKDCVALSRPDQR
jgi:hypothetical protein